MRTGTRVQLLSALLLLAGCVAIAALSGPAVLSAAESSLRLRREVTGEVGSAVAAALDKGSLADLRGTMDSLMEQHPELIAVEVVPADGHAASAFGAVHLLHKGGLSAGQDTSRVTLVRAGRQWGAVTVLFRPTANGAFGTALPWYVIVLVVVVLPMSVVGVEVLRRRFDRSAQGPMAAAAQRARDTLDTLAEGVLLIDPSARVVFANSAFCEMTQAQRSQIEGAPADQLRWTAATTVAGPPSLPWEAVIRHGEAARGVRLGLRRGDSTATVIANCTPLLRGPGRLHGVLVSFEDVTELEQSRAATQAARDQAEHANLAKSSFLAMMSHEIRTPLNGVCGTLQLLKNTPLQKNQSQYIEAATFSASTLLHLINDVLDLSKIEAGQLELSPIEFELDECVDRTILMMVQPARSKGLTLAFHIDPSVAPRFNADPDRIRQVIINLINNALKFTERGAVSLRIGVEKDQATRQLLRCEVADTGIGIPPDKLHRLFKAFSQVDSSTSRRYGGTGLGLVISKQLCEAMGGRIEVASKPGEGTTFTFFLDLEKAPPITISTPAPRFGRALLVGLHDLECLEISAALGIPQADMTAAASTSALLALLRSASPAPAGSEALVVMASADPSDTARAVAELRCELSPGAARLVLASYGPQGPPPTEAGPDCRVVQRPVCRRRLLSALERESAPAQSAAAAPADPATSLDGVRVLLAEDNEVGQMVVSDMLRSAGAQCDVAGDGNAVLAALGTGQYDLVLMDCFMPGLDGFQATQRIREMQRDGALPPRLPVIALTAKAMRGDKEACMKAGMDGYITKPVNQEELMRTVAQHTVHADRAAPTSGEAARPTFDTTALEVRYRDKPEILKKLTDAFRETSAQDLERIEAAIRLGDAASIEQAAHRLAGGAGFVSADAARLLAADLEHRAAERQSDGLRSIADQLRREVAEVLEGLDRLTTPRLSSQEKENMQ